MLAQRLKENQALSESLNEKLALFKDSIDQSDLVVEDVSEFHNQTLFQLDQKHNQTAKAIENLQLLWIVKNLIHEIRLLFDPANEGQYVCDYVELEGILQNIKLLKARISPIVREGLIVGTELQNTYISLLESYKEQLDAMFARHIQLDGSVTTVFTAITINLQQHLLREFLELVASFEKFTGESIVTDRLNSLKPAWDKKLLDPLVNKKKYLRMLVPNTENEYSIDLVEPHTAGHFLSVEFFDSVCSFIKFVNLLENQSFKNYFLTKLSNSIVNLVSENIEQFLQSREQLSAKLVEAIQLARSTGWNLQIAKSLGSIEGIASSIDKLHLEWVTDKHINILRTYFGSTQFKEDLARLRTIEAPVQQIEEPVAQPEPVAAPAPASDTHSEVDWDQPWDSDEDQGAQEEDDWDNNWDDEWDNDEDNLAPASPVKPKQRAEVQHAVIQPPQPTQQMSPEYVTCSGAVETLQTLVHNFVVDSGQEALDDLLFAVCEFALASYPPLHELFLLYNDLKALEFDETSDFAEKQWRHSRIQLFGQINALMSSINFTNNDSSTEATEETAGILGALEQFSTMLTLLAESNLASSNKPLLRATLIEMANHANTWVVDGILASKEITEFQSEKFTRVLESLEEIESLVLVKVGAEGNRLATYNRVKQAILLLNNHLNDIMEHFYQGELFDFSTDELIRVLQSVFIASDLRENCIQEILEVRNS